MSVKIVFTTSESVLWKKEKACFLVGPWLWIENEAQGFKILSSLSNVYSNRVSLKVLQSSDLPIEKNVVPHHKKQRCDKNKGLHSTS